MGALKEKGVPMFQHLKEITTDLVLVCGFSGLCGALSYLFAVEEGKAFTWGSLLLHTTISGVCGLITFAVFESFGGFSPTACGAFAGVSGWMGTRLLSLIESKVAKRMSE